jgi:hypothetical protein
MAIAVIGIRIVRITLKWPCLRDRWRKASRQNNKYKEYPENSIHLILISI